VAPEGPSPEEIADEEKEYDKDPEILENSEDDSEDEAAELAEETEMIPKLIRDAMSDLAEAQGYVHRIVFVYTELGLCDVDAVGAVVMAANPFALSACWYISFERAAALACSSP